MPSQLLLIVTSLTPIPLSKEAVAEQGLESQAWITTACKHYEATQEEDWQPCTESLTSSKHAWMSCWKTPQTYTTDDDVDKRKSATHSRSPGAVIRHQHLTILSRTETRVHLHSNVCETL